MNDIEVEYPFKRLDELFKPDGVQQYFTGDLEDFHRILSEISILEIVPVDVRQLFETSKNVSLYAQFCYRFHQASEIVGYSALELAFKQLCYEEIQYDKNQSGLGSLMRYAKKKKWLDNGYFEDVKESTIYGIRRKRQNEYDKKARRSKEHVEEPSMEVSEAQLRDGLHNSMAVEGLILDVLDRRNDLAHGSKTLHPNSASTLRMIASIINYACQKYDCMSNENIRLEGVSK